MTWISGWVSPTKLLGVAAYAASFAGCVAAWVQSQKRGTSERLFAGLASIQLLLLLDMAFDWRWKLHAYGMQTAMAEGVYGLRRSPQLLVLVALASIAVCCAVLILWKLRHRVGAALAVTGTLLSVALWASEAISYHYLDIVLYCQVGGVMLVAAIWILLAALTCFGIWIERRNYAVR